MKNDEILKMSELLQEICPGSQIPGSRILETLKGQDNLVLEVEKRGEEEKVGEQEDEDSMKKEEDSIFL